MSAPGRDAVEREALADLVCVCREAFGHLTKCYERADRGLAAGWSRSPRPAAVSEEAIEAAAGALHDAWTEMPVREGPLSGREAWRYLAATALPLLAPGQSETSIRADEREKALREFADTLGVNVGDDDSEWWQGYRQGQREALHKATALARTAPAEDGAK